MIAVHVNRRAPSISHLLFADDCLLFCRAIREECMALKNYLNLYERAFEQAINFSKSNIFFSLNVRDGLWHDLKSLTGISNPLNTGKYLGLPSLVGRGKLEIFRYIRDKPWPKMHL